MENFSGLTDGTTVDNGATAWSVDVTACDFTDEDNGYFEVRNNALEGRDTDGEAVWTSEVVDISSYTDVKVSVDLFALGFLSTHGPDDYVRAYYSLDGGPETLFYDGDQSGNFGTVTAFAGSFNGSTIQVIIRMNNSSYQQITWLPAINNFDNVTVYESLDSRYAIQPGGDWNDPATWSYTSGGSTCNCIPDAFSEVHINENDDGQSVALNVDGYARFVTIYNNGLLEWTSNNEELQINWDGGINVQFGGELDGTRNNSKIEFISDGDGNFIENEGTFAIEDLELENSGGSLTLSGGGDITVTDEFAYIDDNITVTNDNTGSIYVQDVFRFYNGNSELINNGTIYVANDLITELDDNSITNNSGGILNFGQDVNAGTRRFVIDNSGLIDQEGRFQNIRAGEVQIYNRAGATWNFAGISIDPQLQMYCNFDANLFNYDGGADQDVLAPQDAYWNLTLSNSGTKGSQGNLDINGNLSIEGSAVLDVASGNDDITLAGNWSNMGTFTEGTRTVTFNGSSAQSISNASGETFYNLIVNNSSTGLTLGNGNVIASNALTMTQGNINVGTNRLTLGTSTANVGTLTHTSGTVIGEFERWLNSTGIDFLYPVGTTSSENFATLNFTALVGGSLIGEFNPTDPGSTGLPISETGYTVSDQFTDGYWDFTAANGLASTGFNIDMDANGFTSYTLAASSRVIKRTNGGAWVFDGTHLDAVPPTVYRTNLTGGISTFGTQLGVGQWCISIVIDRAITDVSCFGGSDGAIDVTTSGGFPGYTFSWSHGPTSEDVSGLSAGDYILTAKDAAGCTQDSTFTIIEPAVLNATVNSVGVTCIGGSDGSITISSPSGGSGSYDYSINGGSSWQASGTFTNLSANTYDVRIRDALATTCEITLDGALVLTDNNDLIPPTFTAPADITIYSDASCAYDANVSATGDVTDEADNCGVGEATYSDAVDASDPCSIVITRTWSLVDDNGNSAADQDQIITVEDNTNPTASNPAPISVECAGDVPAPDV
ncbi:MAG: SprB repeat-containing protein, partial [Bacteroidales bacterium]|nr:SprB repeat-containing protein [Bacteroidales bacterium]